MRASLRLYSSLTRVTCPPPASVLSAIRNACAVAFDVDSTVITTEGIDELAAALGKRNAVAALTRSAMGGSMPFREALSSRLKLLAPTRDAMVDFVRCHPAVLTPGISCLIKALQARGTPVFLVSGGFTQMIHPVADVLGVPRSRVFANTVLFNEATGAYKGFDETAPTSSDGGKARVLQSLKDTHGYKTLIMVGDGATDLQARPPADAFVGYGGVIERDVVKKGADWFVYDWEAFIGAVQSR